MLIKKALKKGKATDWEKIFTQHIFAELYRYKFIQLHNKKTIGNKKVLKQTNDLKRHIISQADSAQQKTFMW